MRSYGNNGSEKGQRNISTLKTMAIAAMNSTILRKVTATCKAAIWLAHLDLNWL